jgi:predicted DNA-binding transcriptional regulator AlpA
VCQPLPAGDEVAPNARSVTATLAFPDGSMPAHPETEPEGSPSEPGPTAVTAPMAAHPALDDLGIAPRLLTRDQAAAYCGLSVYGFSQWVKTGRLPGPIRGTMRWDRKAIDAALDQASGLQATLQPSPLEEWKSRRRAREPQGR